MRLIVFIRQRKTHKLCWYITHIAKVILTQLSFFVNSQIVQNILHEFCPKDILFGQTEEEKNNEKTNRVV